MHVVNVLTGDKDKRSNVGCDGLRDRNKREKDKGKRKVAEKGKKKMSGGANAFVNIFANVIADANSSECVGTSGAVVELQMYLQMSLLGKNVLNCCKTIVAFS